MPLFKDLDPIHLPLEGIHLIEASAGTGKTYTICSLFIRLIVEKGLSVSDVLVVTFTNAATDELKERIRVRLQESIEAFQSGSHEDPFIRALVEKQEDPVLAVERLQEALRQYDEAAIFTIHGFCQRMLVDHAFETGDPFDTELIEDDTLLREEVIFDFWRRHLYLAPPELVHYMMEKRIGPATLLGLSRYAQIHRQVRIIPPMNPPEMAALRAFRQRLSNLKDAWSATRGEVVQILLNAGLNGTLYGTTTPQPEGSTKRERIVSELSARMDHFVSSPGLFPPFRGFEKFTSRFLAASMKKGLTAPEHEFFQISQQLADAAHALQEEMDQWILFFKSALFRTMATELPLKKEKLNARSFDDLLTRVRDALHGPTGKAFARAVRAKFRAALIDEFQDTDEIQYAIFQILFENEKAPLFLIGDPKQAIYAFRGADIFTYMKAAERIEDRRTLRRNWRSESGLIAAINCIFSRKGAPFLYKNIPYSPVAPGREEPRERLRLTGGSNPPLRLWLLEDKEAASHSRPLPKGRAAQLITRALKREISKLVHLGRTGKAFVGDKPLGEAHIAVLVRKNREARLVQQALGQAGIASVLHSTGNLFDSVEAMETERVLRAIAEPDNEGLIRAALSTEILGFSGENLDLLSWDEEAWERILHRFREYHKTWRLRGFISMFRSFTARENVRTRLLALPGGERSLTNLLHLTEVLHRESFRRNLGITGLLSWLGNQRDPALPRLEEHPLRLESDEAAVRVVTIHKSKGLEYPVVFIPFMWDGSEIRDEAWTFHDHNDRFQLTLDLGSPEQETHRALAQQELLAENLRLLYVALTRAKNMCYLVLGRISGSETSALAYLFHGPRRVDPENVMEATASRYLQLDAPEVARDLKTLVHEAKGNIGLESLSQETFEGSTTPSEPEGQLACRRFSRKIGSDWKVSSFSSLVSGKETHAEVPDYDLAPAEESPGVAEGQTAQGIFSFPKGARAGTFLHDVFEHLDYTDKTPDRGETLIAHKLSQYGLESSWAETILQLVARVLCTPLMPGLMLSNIEKKDRLNELEFHFPLRRIRPESFRAVFTGDTGDNSLSEFPETIERLRFSPTRGFMKGFMDLVFRWKDRFYLVDWKSNHLGEHLKDYGQDSLRSVMRKEFYILQYSIYILALDQYLRLRQPGYTYENHFGGVFYIFLRGVDPEKKGDYGIYRDLPPPERILALRRALMDS